MSEYMTTLWENIRGRIVYLKKHGAKMGEEVEVAQALTEELERVYKEIEDLKDRVKELENK